MPPRSRLAVDAPQPDAPAPAAPEEQPETVQAAAEAPSEPAADVVTCVKATASFTVSYGCQLIPIAKDQVVHGDLAVFLSTASVPVEPVDER